MTYQLGIALVMLLCSCSIQDLDPDPDPDPGAPAMGTEEPTGPDSEELPAAARLIAEPVDSVEDVPGHYAQPFALPGQVSTITLGEPNFATGDYELFRSCGLPTRLRCEMPWWRPRLGCREPRRYA